MWYLNSLILICLIPKQSLYWPPWWQDIILGIQLKWSGLEGWTCSDWHNDELCQCGDKETILNPMECVGAQLHLHRSSTLYNECWSSTLFIECWSSTLYKECCSSTLYKECWSSTLHVMELEWWEQVSVGVCWPLQDPLQPRATDMGSACLLAWQPSRAPLTSTEDDLFSVLVYPDILLSVSPVRRST